MHRLALIIVLAASGLTADPNSYFDHYLSFYHNTFQRLIELEEKIDGLDPTTRSRIGDRKKNYPSQFSGKSILLEDPVLIHAVITERKRLEQQQSFIAEISRSPRLKQQFEKQLATDFLALEVNNIIFLYVEHLSDFLSGRRKVKANTESETNRILAATLTALYFSQENKKQMAFFNPEVLKHTQKEFGSTLDLIYESIGPLKADLIPAQVSTSSKRTALNQDKERLEKTKKLLALVDRLGQILLKSNRPLWDEYQYNVLKASKKN